MGWSWEERVIGEEFRRRKGELEEWGGEGNGKGEGVGKREEMERGEEENGGRGTGERKTAMKGGKWH